MRPSAQDRHTGVAKGGKLRPGREPRIRGFRTIDPTTLGEADLQRFGKELFGLHAKIFAGLDEAAFIDYVLKPNAERTRIRVFENEAGEKVGYCAFHLYRKTISGSEFAILRAEAGLLPAYRGHGVTYYLGMVEALRYKLRHPFDRLYYLGMLVHPSSYHLACKYFWRIFPTPQKVIPVGTRKLMLDMADAFEVPVVAGTAGMVREIGWITRDTAQDKRLLAEIDLPDERFFRTQNPGYGQGQGLVVLIPLSIWNLTASFLRYLFDSLVDLAGFRKRLF